MIIPMLLMLLDSVGLFAVLLFIGMPVFHLLIWRPVFASEEISVYMRKRLFLPVVIGAGIFVISGLVTMFYDMSQMESFRLFGSSFGYKLSGFVLTPVFLFCFFRYEARTGSGYLVATIISGLLVLWSMSTGSHAASETGLLPISSHVVHHAAAIVWGGGVLFFLFLPWKQLIQNPESYIQTFWRIPARFSNLTIIMLGMVLLTGAILTFIHVHSDAAMDSTRYGQLLKIKITLVVVLLGAVFLNLLKFVPELKQGGRTGGVGEFRILLGRYRRVMFFEAVIIVFLLLVTGMNLRYEPPDTAPFLYPQSWNMELGDLPVNVEVQPVAGSKNDVRFEIFLPEDTEISGNTSLAFDLYMPESGIGIYEKEAIQASPRSYLGEGVFAVPGDWRFELRIHNQGETSGGVYDFTLPAQPLQDDLKAYLSIAAASTTSTNMMNSIVGILLVITFGWLVWQSRTGSVPGWMSVGGLAGIAAGFYMVLSVMLVKTYPSTFWRNPQPYSAETIIRGQDSFIAECAECHGEGGEGDGPWAIDQGRQVLDLASPHMDVHTDGEIFWWITHGIPSLDMPPREKELTEDQRWSVINYIRSLRHGVPGN